MDIQALIGAAITGLKPQSGNTNELPGKGTPAFIDIIQAMQAQPGGVALPGMDQITLAEPQARLIATAFLPEQAAGVSVSPGTLAGEPLSDSEADDQPGVETGGWWIALLPQINQAQIAQPLVAHTGKPAADATARVAADVAAAGQGLPLAGRRPQGEEARQVGAELSGQLEQEGGQPRKSLPQAVQSSLAVSQVTAGTAGNTTQIANLNSMLPAEADPTGLTPQILPAEKAVEAMARQMSPAQATNLGVPTPVTSREWSTDFAQRVVWMAGQRLQMAEIAVNPPNLGGVEVRLSMHDQQSAGAQFYSPHPTVRDALEAALPRLRDMFAEAGINLGQAEVRDQAFSNSQERADMAAGEAPEMSGLASTAPMSVSHGRGLVDLYA